MTAETPLEMRLNGSCPVCGRDVPRAAAWRRDGTHEVYRCPEHGAIEYGPRRIGLLEPGGGIPLVPPQTAVWEV